MVRGANSPPFEKLEVSPGSTASGPRAGIRRPVLRAALSEALQTFEIACDQRCLFLMAPTLELPLP
jgi:hypothetical protein